MKKTNRPLLCPTYAEFRDGIARAAAVAQLRALLAA